MGKGLEGAGSKVPEWCWELELSQGTCTGTPVARKRTVDECALQTPDLERRPRISSPPITIEGFLLSVAGITYRVVVGRLKVPISILQRVIHDYLQ